MPLSINRAVILCVAIAVLCLIFGTHAYADLSTFRFDVPAEQRICVFRHDDGTISKSYCHIPPAPRGEGSVSVIAPRAAVEELEEL